MSEWLNIFKALSDETRFKIVKLLLDGEKCVCEIIPETGRTQSTVSTQLNKLETMDILTSRREGKSVYYRISNPRVSKLLDHSHWMGLERKKIEWYPQIDEEKCDGCGLCIEGCEREVMDLEPGQDKAVVANPYNCKVGCTTCGVYCLRDAISFPHKEYVRELIREYGLTERSKVKKQKI
ncbi:MAG: metalloregulator ArsR/SmtB family transcription factor [Archaeoglobaceae archaeon]